MSSETSFPRAPCRLRVASEADLGAILDLFRTTVRSVNARDYAPGQIDVWAAGADAPERWRERLASQYFLLAEDESGLAGFASMTAEGYIDTLFAAADRQGRGVGSLLTGHLVHQAYRLGIPVLTSEVSITARPLFERMGFVVVRAQDKELRGVLFRNFLMRRELPPPVLTTGRLLLKPFGPEDAWDFFLLNEDPVVLQYTGDEPFAGVGDAAAFLAGYDQYARYGYGRWTVLRRDDGAYLGWCGLKYHPDANEVDLGFRFYRRHWNRGYATEAARACLDHGFGPLELTRIVGRAYAANAASIRVLEKCGMHFWKDFTFDGHPGVYYAIDKE